jgi:hypothetical protein
MDQDKLNTILTNVLQNVFKLEDVSNIIGKFRIYKHTNLLEIRDNAVQHFITYIYANNKSMFINSINKYYKNIYLSNNPKKIRTDKFACIYYDSIKHIIISSSEKIINNLDCLFLQKDFQHNLTQYIYRTNYEPYVYLCKYKINYLIYKKNVKNIKNKINLYNIILLNKLFIQYNFSYSYNFSYLL